MKRQRVGIACDKCRLLKAKCDGRPPVCARCEGYGFRCTWSSRKTRRAHRDITTAVHDPVSGDLVESDSLSRQHVVPVNDQLPLYRQAVQSYEALIKSFKPHLESPQRAAVDISLNNIRHQLPKDVLDIAYNDGAGSPEAEEDNVGSPTYVGKVSDIHFIHAVRQCMQEREPLAPEELAEQSYDQSAIPESLIALGHPMQFPSRDEARQFLDIYLSTIHIAYPFLCKATVLSEFEKLWTEDKGKPQSRPWLALFNFIFAIGSYYTSFPHGRAGIQRHHRYFEQGLFFSRELGATCTLTNVSLLLVQCFFLLAVCQTNRCWNILGFAIRMAQSIGLHVETLSRDYRVPNIAEREQRRRTWYSIYVLDTLLALQLGRPMAIHASDFQVELPARSDQLAFGSEGFESEEDAPVMMDYFLQVIHFSHVIGLTIQELYQPTQIELSADRMLYSASSLDEHLAEWKSSLPRHLRFDLGHTFEKSIAFRRQRNMLAVKFHHLRALIHRPFLCLPLLQMNNKPFMDFFFQKRQQIARAEWICISEAQQTAHLLHNVMDERSLVHDFPWWQMISCLFCAASILFIAEAFYSNDEFNEGKPSTQTLREDAEICLKVFEALSVNSAAARKAVSMLKSLSHLKRLTEAMKKITSASQATPYSVPEDTPTTTPNASTLRPTLEFDPELSMLSADLPSEMFAFEWPSEISSVMEWSAQILGQSQRHPEYSQADSVI